MSTGKEDDGAEALAAAMKALSSIYEKDGAKPVSNSIPWVVRLYVEIIHELKIVEYLTYRWTNMVKLSYTTYISVDLAQHEIFRA